MLEYCPPPPALWLHTDADLPQRVGKLHAWTKAQSRPYATDSGLGPLGTAPIPRIGHTAGVLGVAGFGRRMKGIGK